jgi:alcohol dehydrogenase class IV
VHVGLDALCQLIEPYVSNAANPITDALAKEGITRAARSLRYLYELIHFDETMTLVVIVAADMCVCLFQPDFYH